MPLATNEIYHGDANEILEKIEPESISLSVWSPPYFVGKSYEKDMTFETWQDLLQGVIRKHFRILKAGSFLAINIADILCFQDATLPKIQAENIDGKNRLPVTKQDVMRVLENNPKFSRYQIADILGVSEQTVDRRLKNNNIRGGKHNTQTRVQLVGGIVNDAAYAAGLYLYDRRIWVKDPCWENSRWHSNSYRAVDEFEHLYIFWKPGITKVTRERLERKEWSEWGSRAVWRIQSVRSNNDHEAKFPLELPRRAICLFTDPGDIVLDCFVGSGTTAVAAIENGRQFIGIDNQAKYVKLAKKKCQDAILPTSLLSPDWCLNGKYRGAAHANGTCSSIAKN